MLVGFYFFRSVFVWCVSVCACGRDIQSEMGQAAVKDGGVDFVGRSQQQLYSSEHCLSALVPIDFLLAVCRPVKLSRDRRDI